MNYATLLTLSLAFLFGDYLRSDEFEPITSLDFFGILFLAYVFDSPLFAHNENKNEAPPKP